MIGRLIKYIKGKAQPVYRQEQTNHPDKQVLEIKCYKNDKYTHTVNLHYFTEEQIKRLHEAADNVYKNT